MSLLIPVWTCYVAPKLSEAWKWVSDVRSLRSRGGRARSHPTQPPAGTLWPWSDCGEDRNVTLYCRRQFAASVNRLRGLQFRPVSTRPMSSADIQITDPCNGSLSAREAVQHARGSSRKTLTSRNFGKCTRTWSTMVARADIRVPLARRSAWGLGMSAMGRFLPVATLLSDRPLLGGSGHS